MALYDENGTITIDENAADYDIRRINEALFHLQNSRAALNNLIKQAVDYQGNTGTAIIEKATELRSQVDDMINRLNETATFIRRTVDHYQWLDHQVKEAIIASENISDTFFGNIIK